MRHTSYRATKIEASGVFEGSYLNVQNASPRCQG